MASRTERGRCDDDQKESKLYAVRKQRDKRVAPRTGNYTLGGGKEVPVYKSAKGDYE